MNTFFLELAPVSLAQIAGSGQCFRWKKLGEGRFAVPVHGEVFEIAEENGGLSISADMDENRAHALMRDYFDADTDYGAVIADIDPADVYLTRAARAFSGIRILHQPLWEMTVSAIISANNNVPRIRQILARLCGGELAPFPEPEAVAGMTESELRAMGTGYRAPYILEAAKRFADGEGERILEMTHAEAKTRLLTIKGVGEKVASCIMLFALAEKSAFPVDVWVRRILERHYPNGFGRQQSEFAGIYQQYMFAYETALEHRGAHRGY